MQALASLSKLPTLRSLSLSDCSAITNNGMQVLAGLTGLQKLAFVRCPRISEKGLELIQALPHLRSLTVFGCSKVGAPSPELMTHLTCSRGGRETELELLFERPWCRLEMPCTEMYLECIGADLQCMICTAIKRCMQSWMLHVHDRHTLRRLDVKKVKLVGHRLLTSSSGNMAGTLEEKRQDF